MACFENIVGVRGLCDDITYVQYLDNIGINKQILSQINTKPYADIKEFVDAKSAFAIEKVTSEIYSRLSPKFKANSILTGNRVGYEAADKELITQSGFVGVEIKVKNRESYINFVLSDISLFTDFTGVIPVFIYDLKQGKLLATINVDSVGGQISIDYTKTVIESRRNELHLWMGYDATAINSYKTTTFSSCGSCQGYTFSHRYIQATGASAASPFTATTIDSLTHTAGISFNYSVECNHYNWLCEKRDILKIAFLYKTGIEIMNHALIASVNTRANTITTVNSDTLESSLAHFTYEYDTIMKSILNAMKVPQDKNCFECNDRIYSAFGL